MIVLLNLNVPYLFFRESPPIRVLIIVQRYLEINCETKKRARIFQFQLSKRTPAGALSFQFRIVMVAVVRPKA